MGESAICGLQGREEESIDRYDPNIIGMDFRYDVKGHFDQSEEAIHIQADSQTRPEII